MSEPTIQPTERELDVLRELWELGPSTVREVHKSMSQREQIGRTTVLKILQIMFEKGLVTRDESEYSHVYSPARRREEVEVQLVSRFMERVFAGSAMSLVARALDVKPASADELEEIQRLIAEAREDESE